MHRLGQNHTAPSRLFPLSVAFAALAVSQIGALIILDRDWGAGCEGLVQMAPSPDCNSRHFADAYTLLHVGFGMALALMFRMIRPAWPKRDILLLVIFSSVVWEIVENLPPVIAMFGYQDGDPLAYSGDSVPNSIGDTLAAGVGAAVAGMMHPVVVVILVLTIEIGVTFTIRDGYIIALLRAIGAA